MHVHPAVEFFGVGEGIGRLSALTDANSPLSANGVVPDVQRAAVRRMVDKMAGHGLFASRFPFTAKSVERMQHAVDDPDLKVWTLAEVLRDFSTRLRDELEQGLFLAIEPAYINHCMHPGFDWPRVIETFPDSNDDILQASQCLAFERGTATVFHCMRILERGLRAFGQHVGLGETEFGNWQNIIDQIEKAIRGVADTAPKGRDKSEKLKRWSQAATEFRYFKDAWRNHVAHARESYDIYQAASIYEHVREFMATLCDVIAPPSTGAGPFAPGQSSDAPTPDAGQP